MTLTIGLNDVYHDSSFCLAGDRGTMHVELERFSRRKLERLSAVVGLVHLLDDGLADVLADTAAIGIVEGDFTTPLLRRLMLGGEPAALTEFFMSELQAGLDWHPPNFPLNLTRPARFEEVRDGLRAFVDHGLRPGAGLRVLGHHLCHAADAFLVSPHDSALCVTLDGGGYDFPDGSETRALVYGGIFRGEGQTITPVSYDHHQAIGTAWARVTVRVLGLQFGEEGTAMAMAAFGDPARFATALAGPELWSPGNVDTTTNQAAYDAELSALTAAMRTEQDRFDLAAGLQAATERRVRAILARALTPHDRVLCLSGGVSLNCQWTGKVRDWFPQLEHVFIPPAPYDGGLSQGAALYLRHAVLGAPREPVALAAFASGPVYDGAAIAAACDHVRVVSMAATPHDIAVRLAGGEIGGVFAGPAESGRRALGHRSILADPRTAQSRTRINKDIKHRAAFRPLAPMVLAEHAAAWFQCPAGFQSPYMSFASPVRPERADRIPAVLHHDGTARVQTVHAALTPGLHALLTAWHRVSGVPVLLNTSFNENEPIVQTPGDALDCYLRTPLDFLFFADAGLVCAKTTPRRAG